MTPVSVTADVGLTSMSATTSQTARGSRALVAAAVIALGIVGAVGVAVWLGIVLILAGAGLLVAHWLTQTPALDGVLTAGAALGASARVENLTRSVSTIIGAGEVELFTVSSPSINVAACQRPDGGTVVVLTSGAQDHLGVVETEGLLAAALVRAQSEELSRSRGHSRRRGGMGSGDTDAIFRHDREAARATRFPPALADAYATAVARGTQVIGVAPATHPLWLFDVAAEPSGNYPDLGDRITLLREL